MKVFNIKQAEEWFLSNSEGNLVCVKDGTEKEVDCYPKAREFFEVVMTPEETAEAVKYEAYGGDY